LEPHGSFRDRQAPQRIVSLFALAGHISKEDAKEISGLDNHAFEHAYDKASNIAESVMQHEGKEMDKFLEHFAK
jgi:hypothetical protein